MRRPILLALLFAIFFALPAAAQIGKRGPNTSITISPIHLLLPVVEVTGEFKMQEKVGMAGIVGIGSIDNAFAFELGGQARYYLIGDFDHGMQIGGELIYSHISDDNVDNSGVSASGNGLALGPFLGYKLALGFGLTFDLQGGVEFMLVRAKAEDTNGNTGSAEGAAVIPLLNINLGWSF